MYCDKIFDDHVGIYNTRWCKDVPCNPGGPGGPGGPTNCCMGNKREYQFEKLDFK